MSYPYPNYVYSIFVFISFLLVSIPFPWHLEAWNTGTCLYMFWTALACLNQFVNSIVWSGNAINWAPVWCDISARIIIGTSFAIPAASLCINRRLYHIACVQSVTVTKAEKRRAIMVDLAIGLGIPILGMILQYIPQGHRFNIFEDLGCYPFTYNTPVAFVLVYCPPVLIGLTSGYYCVRSILAFNKRRLQFKELLSANSGRLTSNRYFRLMGLACTDVALTVPLGLYAISLNARLGISPWLGWADTHYGFSRVDQIPGVLWRMDKTFVTAVELSRWSIVFCAFVFFFFFGFADEARKHYRIAFDSVAKRVGYITGGTMSSTGTFNEKRSYPAMGSTGTGVTLPVFVHTDMITKRESYASFSDMSFTDAGGALDVKTDIGYSSSSSSSTLSVPEQAHTRQDVVGIEISSVRGIALDSPSPTPSESSLNKENPPRHTPDTPSTYKESDLSAV
ncbi:G-protein coupled receptor 4 family protein [Pleurotus pulmonarius]